MKARTFLAQGIAATALAIGMFHSVELTPTSAGADETSGRIIVADDKWDVVPPAPPTGAVAAAALSSLS
ncbi:hypothetical protein B046DRAFT_04043 [Streptomyces sp. LamerLS-316]|uniref:Uncharacterized protein n=1 Tax=Streptomyces sp. NBC_00148 TaxID=2903626 RepID=A0AAU1M0S2_9ACTN|nr:MULTISPECIES: hypothetical protein [unclassified Streptomyces]MYQ39273.1 hypothetical protein [Streptomyces sp. SID4921]SCK42071.1 hypothetical protein B046DRAFT_04043 [Streptomyces sp. LamerLS-316]